MTTDIMIKKTIDGYYCSAIAKCEKGHLRYADDGGGKYGAYCGSPCECQEWAKGYSFYRGPSIAKFTIKNPKVKEILDELKPDVCSYISNDAILKRGRENNLNITLR
uniref:Uncharacterized protein n=1 Tax=Acrobeloides nanus TaxID=290746 RepID=A0A914D8L5_9BILA